MKQTAIQLLKEKWYKGILLLQKDFDEFEEMEKQQIKDAYQTSHISMMTAEQYYNETFKQEQNEN